MERWVDVDLILSGIICFLLSRSSNKVLGLKFG